MKGGRRAAWLPANVVANVAPMGGGEQSQRCVSGCACGKTLVGGMT